MKSSNRKAMFAKKDIKTPDEYYVKEEKGMLVLRQTRFMKQKREHAHDVMAYARTPKEMQGMINLITGNKNYSRNQLRGN